MAKKIAKRKTSGTKKATSKKKTTAKKKTTGKKKTSSKKKVVKMVTVGDLARVDEFGGRHRARVARRPLMRDIRLDQKRVTKWQREMRTP